MSDMRLIVAGAGGRMGRTLVKAIADTDGAILAGAVDAPGSAVIGRDAGELAGLGVNGIKVTADPAPLLAKADGLVDFTIPAATIALAEIVAKAGLVHVIGTTGLSSENEKLIATAAQRSVIVKSGNMSLGVNLLAALAKRVAATLDAEFDIEIVEMHHNRKVDAPSVSAIALTSVRPMRPPAPATIKRMSDIAQAPRMRGRYSTSAVIIRREISPSGPSPRSIRQARPHPRIREQTRSVRKIRSPSRRR